MKSADAAATPNAYRLLWAGFMAIMASGVGFSIRAGILGQWAENYGFTQTDLGKITAPIRLYRSVEDHVVEPLSAKLLMAGATSTTVEEIMLEDSYHVATLDNDAPQIFAGSVEFFQAHTTERTP